MGKKRKWYIYYDTYHIPGILLLSEKVKNETVQNKVVQNDMIDI